MKHLIPFTIFFLVLLPFSNAQLFQNANYRISSTPYQGTTVLGNGVSFCDFNNDGFDDLSIATSIGTPPLFYINNNGIFTPTALATTVTCASKHIIWVDYDNDGDRDLYITCEEGVNRLFNNDGNLNLTDVTISSGLPLYLDPSYGAAFGDFDKDGWLDLYWVNRSFGGEITTYSNYMYRNMGNGTFQNVTSATATADYGKGPFCSAFIDYDDDGWQDIYISVDKYFVPNTNTMLRNSGSGSYLDVSVPTGTNIAVDAMSVTPGDYDNDGDEDIYITNSDAPPYNILYRNNGNNTFTNVATQAGVLFQSTSWAANFLDFNNDTELDLYVSSVIPTDYNALYQNQGNLTFTQHAIPGDNFVSFSNAVGNITNDGKPDIITGGYASFPCVLFENITTSANNYIEIDLVGTTSNREGIGTWIHVYANGETYSRYTHCGEGYLNQNSFTTHIGVGAATVIDSIKLRWLSGIQDLYYSLAPNQRLSLIEGTSNSNLPVELTKFQATPGQSAITLKWSTQTEVNFSKFELQRGMNESDFSTIAEIEGLGNAFSGADYSFKDKLVVHGKTYYYRLKMLDKDQTVSHSQIVAASLLPGRDHSFSITPNPVSASPMTIDILSSSDLVADVYLYTLTGQIIESWNKMGLIPGINEFDMSKPLPQGIYILTLKHSGSVLESFRVVVL